MMLTTQFPVSPTNTIYLYSFKTQNRVLGISGCLCPQVWLIPLHFYSTVCFKKKHLILKYRSFSSINSMGSNNVPLKRGSSAVLIGLYVYHRINSLYEFILSQILDDGVKNDDEDFVLRVVLIFHLSGQVNRPNVKIWGTENPHKIVRHAQDFPKDNMQCSLTKKSLWSFFH